MINYFKHTSGEAFTLNGNPYNGFFNIIGGNVITGKLSSSDSENLLHSDTFISSIYTNGIELDTTFTNTPKLTAYFSNTFDLFDLQGIRNYTNSIDNNNLTCFKSLVLGNPTIFKFEETGGRYYGLVSNLEENSEFIPIKTDYRGNINPFSDSIYWKFLDTITTGAVIVNSSEVFKYICSDGVNDYILTGTFTDNTPLTLSYVKINADFDQSSPSHTAPDYTFSIHHDIENSKLLFVKLNSIEIYDISNFDECETLILVDRLPLNESILKFNIWNVFDESPNTTPTTWGSKYRLYDKNSSKYIKFGQNFRSSISSDVLTLHNKYSTEVYQNIQLSNYGISNLISLDIRPVDDYITILHKSNDGILSITFFDPTQIDETIKTSTLYSINALHDVKVEFSGIDSNVFYTFSENEYQSRYISAPEYPSGRLEVCDLIYPYKYTWNTTNELYNFSNLQWNTASKKSNTFNNLHVSHYFTNNKMYMILHNIGRIYALQQPANDRFLAAIPLDLPKNFTSVSCNQTSIGLSFNYEMSKLILDTVNIFTNASNAFTITEYNIMESPIYAPTIGFNDLYINGNETLNVIVLQRISTASINLQNQLLTK
jgi:hypothetical protein